MEKNITDSCVLVIHSAKTAVGILKYGITFVLLVLLGHTEESIVLRIFQHLPKKNQPTLSFFFFSTSIIIFHQQKENQVNSPRGKLLWLWFLEMIRGTLLE